VLTLTSTRRDHGAHPAPGIKLINVPTVLSINTLLPQGPKLWAWKQTLERTEKYQGKSLFIGNGSGCHDNHAAGWLCHSSPGEVSRSTRDWTNIPAGNIGIVVTSTVPWFERQRQIQVSITGKVKNGGSRLLPGGAPGSVNAGPDAQAAGLLVLPMWLPVSRVVSPEISMMPAENQGGSRKELVARMQLSIK